MSSDLTFLFSAHNKTNIKDWDSFLKHQMFLLCVYAGCMEDFV